MDREAEFISFFSFSFFFNDVNYGENLFLILAESIEYSFKIRYKIAHQLSHGTNFSICIWGFSDSFEHPPELTSFDLSKSFFLLPIESRSVGGWSKLAGIPHILIALKVA